MVKDDTQVVVVEVPVPVTVGSQEQLTQVGEAPEQAFICVEQSQIVVVAAGQQGPPGKPAPVVSVGGISLDPGNSITNGTDGGLYAPDDIPTDPLAYYILARS